jgi:large subunit ribosomal protein L21
MEPYAVIETGGKQYMVKPNDFVLVERIDSDVGSTIEISKVLAVSDGTKLRIGQSYLDGVKVKATVEEHKRGPKVVAFKKKRRKGYSRKVGHRQELTLLKIVSIEQGG